MNLTKIALLALLIVLSIQLSAQTPGIIVRPAGSAGPAVLDPNTNGYTSLTTAGFGSNDVTSSEIAYKTVVPVISEPTGDLLRGPSGKFSDIVKTFDGSGFYLFNDGTNFLCRIRMGGIVSGSKGYSILLDTDSKFGSKGASADPNYQAATNGNNGNPGFELEVVLETNFRIAIYNADGTSTPTLITSYPIANNSQISIAATLDGGDLDFFYDFYVPFSAMGITAATPLRATATTVMAPAAAIGGPKSDIYGIAGGDYMTDWETVINTQPPFTLNDIASGGSGISANCTAAPTLNSPIVPTATSISGTWTKATNSTVTSATITIYKNGTSIGTTTVSTGNTWTLTGVSGLAGGNVITAKAQGVGESMCLASNAVSVNACNSSNTPPTPVLTCYSGSKGINGTNLTTGWTVFADNLTRSTTENSVNNTGALFGANVGSSPNITWQFSGGCSSGAPLTSGSYKIYYVNPVNGCTSEPAYFCAAGNGGNALAGSIAAPTITTPANSIFTTATQSIIGTTTVSASVKLYINGLVLQTVTANATTGAFTFPGVVLALNDKVHLTVEKNTGTVATSYCAGESAVFTVSCNTAPPVITTDNAGKIAVGSAITGTSFEATGTTIKVYTSAAVLVSNTTVQAGGTWSTTVGATPASYTAVASTSYYATAQTGSCGVSGSSSTVAALTATSSARCGTITGPVAANAVSVAGTLSTAVANTLVTLYLDGTSIGTTTTSITAWSITVNTTPNNTLYSSGVLTIGITEPSKTEVICAATQTINCVSPAAPVATPTPVISGIGRTQTYSITSSLSGILYSLRDNADANNYGTSLFGNGGAITLTSSTFTTTGALALKVKATSFSGPNCVSLSAVSLYLTADTDGDGLSDNIDIDDDNDGITDTNETGGIDPDADADGDGIPNYLDTSYPSFTDANSDGVNDNFDADKDGIINSKDVDSDNDAITDIKEAGGTDANGDGRADSLTDTDGDGLVNTYDTSNGGTTIANTDTDGDGIPNARDLDSDNDGITDLVEAGVVDTNGDGRTDGVFADSDGDGLANIYDASTGGVSVANLDTDGDGIVNAVDLDSDNDGIPDVVEAGGTDANNDGKLDGFTDTDTDGLAQSVDGDANNDGTAENTAGALIITGTDGNADGKPDTYSRANTDKLGLPDAYDLDADSDGILDVREAGFADTNGDGVADGTLGTDGWSDTMDALVSLSLTNTDAHGKANYLDIDSDNDGIVDNIEGQTTLSYLAPAGTDADNDGIDDNYDNNDAAFAGSANNGIVPVDDSVDADTTPDYIDMDSDGDGKADVLEGWDTNGNGIIAGGEIAFAGTTDSDGDGLFNEYDNDDVNINPTNGTTPSSYPDINTPGGDRDWRQPVDNDKDGIADNVDVDDDNDGITDLLESGGVNPLADADGDGIPNYLDATPGAGVPAFVDTNSDGIADAFDYDKDGIINAFDLDSDNDSITDLVEAGGVDTNGDGRIDGVFADSDGDGLANIYDASTGGVAVANLDTDGDGIVNAGDLDSDNDGIPDVVEAVGTDINNDGKLDGFIDTDSDGLAQSVDGDANNDGTVENTAGALIITGIDGNADGKPDSYSRANTDANGLPDAYDLDADGDGILDVREAGFADINNDGIVDGTLGADGWSDTIDALASLSLTNTDANGKADYLDIDADNDGIPDNIEGQSTATYITPANADSDNDGIDNAYDNNDAAFAGSANNGIVPVDDSDDADTTPDYIDTESDDDARIDKLEGWDTDANGVIDGIEVAYVGTTDTDGDGLFDEYDNDDNNVNPTNGTTPSSYPDANLPGGDRDWRQPHLVVLPVTLVNFNAEEKNDIATIKWSAENEVNFERYDVERSITGRDFAGIATVKPIEGSAKHDYVIKDDLKKVAANVIYYRLKMIDKDGTSTFSNVAIIKLSGQLKKAITVNPNPVIESMQVSITSDVNTKAFISVFNSSGALVYKTQQSLVKGTNLVAVQNLTRLSKGTYIIHAIVDGKDLITKFISAR